MFFSNAQTDILSGGSNWHKFTHPRQDYFKNYGRSTNCNTTWPLKIAFIEYSAKLQNHSSYSVSFQKISI